MKHILIIDDIQSGNMLEEALHQEGYLVTRTHSGTQALMVLSALRPDLVLLDLTLPGLSCENILPKIKDIPTIVISAKADIQTKTKYLPEDARCAEQPPDTKELLARIAVILHKSAPAEDQVLHYGSLRLDLSAHRVLVNDHEVRLTRTEYAILKLLMQNRPQAVTKAAILEQISVDTPDCTESSLKMHVSNLRRKLRDVSGKDHIEAVWRTGFKLREE